MRARTFGVAGVLLVAGAVGPSWAAGAGEVTVGPGHVIDAPANAPATPVQSPVSDALLAPRLTSADRTNATIAKQSQRPTGVASAPSSGLAAPFAPPTFQAAFNGEDIATCCLRPPDTEGAVGPTQFVQTSNGEGVSVFRKTDGVKLKQTLYPTFFGYSAKDIFDARVIYDPVWNRWVIHAEAFPESTTIQRVFLAVSTTSDATGGFCIYNFDVPEAAASDDFYDFPQLGMDQDAIIITANIFDSQAETAPYLRSRVYGISKAALYNCRGFSFPYFSLGAVQTVAPPVVQDNNSNDYLISFFNATTVKLFRATNLGRSGATVALQANVAIPSVTAGPDMRQPGSTNTLGPPTGRFQNNSTQIGDALLNVHTIAQASFPTPKWYQFDTQGAGANTVSSSGVIFESTTSDDSNPHIVGSPVGGTATNPIGRMFVTWNATNFADPTPANRHQVRVKASGRLATDAVNISGGSTLTTAGVAYNPSTDVSERWGDYSAATIDPSGTSACPVGNRAWVVNERHISATLWGSRIGRVGFC